MELHRECKRHEIERGRERETNFRHSTTESRTELKRGREKTRQPKREESIGNCVEQVDERKMNSVDRKMLLQAVDEKEESEAIFCLTEA